MDVLSWKIHIVTKQWNLVTNLSQLCPAKCGMLRGMQPEIGSNWDGLVEHLSHKTTKKLSQNWEIVSQKLWQQGLLSQGGDSAMLRGCAVAGRWSAPSESRPVPVAPSSELPARDHRSPPSPTHFGTRPTCSILIIRLNQTCQKTGTLAIQTLTH